MGGEAAGPPLGDRRRACAFGAVPALHFGVGGRRRPGIHEGRKGDGRQDTKVLPYGGGGRRRPGQETRSCPTGNGERREGNRAGGLGARR